MDPSRWSAQTSGQPSQPSQLGRQSYPQQQASTSAQPLLSVYPFASTVPSENTAQPASVARAATDVRGYPSVLYPQYYDQGNSSPYSEYERSVQALQGSQAGNTPTDAAYWSQHQQRALRLLSEEQQTVPAIQSSSYPVASQSTLQRPAVHQSSSAYTYPTYHQPTAFSSSLLQSYSYSQQSSLTPDFPYYNPPYQQVQASQAQSQYSPAQYQAASQPTSHPYQPLYQSQPSQHQYAGQQPEVSQQGYVQQTHPVVHAHPQHRAYNTSFAQNSFSSLEPSPRPAAPFERLLSDTRAMMLQSPTSVPTITSSLSMSTASLPGSSGIFASSLLPVPPFDGSRVRHGSAARVGHDPTSSSSTAAAHTPSKLKATPRPPGTDAAHTPSKPKATPRPPDTDSPDPLMMGPFSRRHSGVSEQSSPANGGAPHAYVPQPSSPLKRKVSSTHDEIDPFASPTKKRLETTLVIELPARPKPHPLETVSVSPVKPPSQARSGSSSSQSRYPRLEAYVLVPPHPDSQRAKREREQQAEQNARANDGYLSMRDEVESDEESIGTRIRRSGVKTSGKRTGDRDDRAATQKLIEYLEDIFEAEDTLPASSRPGSPNPVSTSPTVATSSSTTAIFSQSLNSSGEPALTARAMKRLLRYVEGCSIDVGSRRRKAQRGALREVGAKNVNSLSRILRILERSVKLATDYEPFPQNLRIKSSKPTPKKGKNKSARGRKSEVSTPSRSGLAGRKSTDVDGRSESQAASEVPLPSLEADEELDVAQEDSPGPDEQQTEELTEIAIERCTNALETVLLGVLAADCCLALLTADMLPKQLYSEDLIKSCLGVVRYALESVIYPVVEVAASDSSSLIRLIIDSPSPLGSQQLVEIFQSILSVLPRIDVLISHGEHAMPEEIIIAATYIAIGPFFIGDSSSMGDDIRKGKGKVKDASVFALGGKAGFPALRFSAMSVLRSIFANHADQRSGIIEEILTSMIKLPDIKRKGAQFKLRNGKTIHIISALLLQLVQTTARDLRVGIKRMKAKAAASTLGSQYAQKPGEVIPLDTETLSEMQHYKSGLEQAQSCARTILMFLVNRSGKGKTTKDSNEAEYRAILDNFIGDLITVLYWPEWPAASLLLRVACKVLMSSLEDLKTTADNATKQLALDHLGVIAAQLRSITLGMQAEEPSGKRPYRSLEEIVASCGVNRFRKLSAAYGDTFAFLAKRASDDQSCITAREFSIAMWSFELGSNLSLAVEILESHEPVTAERIGKGTELVAEMASALRDVWKSDTGDVFESSSEMETATIDKLSQLLGACNPIQSAFDPILNVILSALASPAVFMRTKALRALAQIVTCDPETLRRSNVRQSIESHLSDSSSAVREAAIELIGKYVVQEPTLAGEYYGKLSDRIADTGLGVRKRVMKLLRTLYDVTSDLPRRADICVKMIQRLQDEDETVKDLAVKSMEEMWFSPTSQNSRAVSDYPPEDMRVFMRVVGLFQDRGSLLEDLLRQILQAKNGKEDAFILDRYTALCDALINRLVDEQEAPDFNVVSCIHGIYLLATSHKKVISGSNAEILLPYLKVATTADEQAISDSVLKVFRAAIPGMPRTAIKFGEELQKVLLPMISKPKAVGGVSLVAALQETVACLCTVVNNLTHDYARLVTLLRPCNAQLQAACKTLDATSNTIPLLMFIVALLNEHCDFDAVRAENMSLAPQLDAISTGSITEHFYGLFLSLYQKQRGSGISTAALQCLGIMFKAYPKLITNESTLSLMDDVFASDDAEARGRTFRILQDFLASESAKRAEEERVYKKSSKKAGVDMEELIGSSTTFADSGVASTVIQRYLRYILEGALSSHPPTQRFSVDILAFTIKQGLAHPIQCLPALIALETSEDSSLAARAGTLHAVLQDKHASLLNSRFLDCARKSFEYQMRVCQGAVRGFRGAPAPTALLHRWYSLVRDKRGPRQDLLKAVMKALDVDSTILACTENDVDFIRYMAENVSALEFKTLEEVLTVVRSLMSTLSVAGMQLVHTLARLDLGDQISSDTTEGVLITQAGLAGEGQLQVADPFPLMRCSVAVGIILVLKGYLKGLYGLSEEKCLKFVIGKKSVLGDKPAARKHNGAMDYERLPCAMTRLVAMEDLQEQRKRFLQLWAEDGVTQDPADDIDMEQQV